MSEISEEQLELYELYRTVYHKVKKAQEMQDKILLLQREVAAHNQKIKELENATSAESGD